MDKATTDTLNALLAKQPKKKNKVEWTDIEVAQLTSFIHAAKEKGISINTMKDNFKELITPIFPTKSKSAFWKQASIIVKTEKLEAEAAKKA